MPQSTVDSGPAFSSQFIPAEFRVCITKDIHLKNLATPISQA